MNEFESVDHLNQVFKMGRFVLPDNITVSGIPYHLSRSISHDIPKMAKEGKKDFVVYAIDPSTKKSDLWKYISHDTDGKLKEWIVLIWAIDSTLSIRPARVATNSAARAKTDLETASRTLGENSNIIPDTVTLKFTQFNKQLPGKVDTGANLSSLHCEEWRVISGKNLVEFKSSLLSENMIRTELHEQVAIKTSEGSEYRPVVALDVNINGKSMQSCKFNLNDRSHMQDKILVGQNILEKGQFLVDPNKQKDRFEDIDWDALQKLYKDVEIIEESLEEKQKRIDEIYHTLLNSNISLSELVRHIKTLAYETLEETDSF